MAHRVVTIKDIAKALNISVATVSRAMRNTYDVNEQTREKVLSMAAALNYKPNFNATGLAQGRTHNLGVVLPSITNYYFATVITGIQEVAYQNGYNITLFLTNDSYDRELSVINNLTITSLDGLLVSISSDSTSCAHFQQMIDMGLPVVFFDRVPVDIKTSKVMQDDYNGSFAAVEHLAKNGYKRIAHLAGPKGLRFTEKRFRGYREALEKYKLPYREEWVTWSGFSQECGEQDAHQLLDLEERPDAIFAATDSKAIGAMLVLKSRNIAIGKEFGVVGFTNDPICTIISPTLSTIAEPAFEIGKKSCELLIKHITKKHFQPEEIVLPAKLIARQSGRQSL